MMSPFWNAVEPCCSKKQILPEVNRDCVPEVDAVKLDGYSPTNCVSVALPVAVPPGFVVSG